VASLRVRDAVLVGGNDAALLATLLDDLVQRRYLAHMPWLEERARSLAADFASCAANGGQVEEVRTSSGDDGLVTYREAADFLCMGVRTLHRRVKDGTVPAVRLGSLVRFRRSDLEALRG
jgi:excisionase family DNA binding protein